MTVQLRSLGVPVQHFGAMGNDTADDYAAFVAALATGYPIIIPATASGIYRLGQKLTVPSGARIIMDEARTPTLKNMATGFSAHTLDFSSNSDIRITRGKIDGNGSIKGSGYGLTGNGCSDIVLDGVTITNCREEGINVQNASRFQVVDGAVTANGASGVNLSGCDHWLIKNTNLSGNTYFGTILNGASNNGMFRDNWCTSSGLELIGEIWNCYDNAFIDNRAEHSGDNGFSINGYRPIVLGNRALSNAFHGFLLACSNGVINGNIAGNNGQGSGTHAGFAFQFQYGAMGRDNVFGAENLAYDDQAVPTQDHSVLLLASELVAWAQGQVISATGTVRSNGDNFYRATTTGTTGATPPTHITGTASDGTVTWQYCGSRQRGYYDRQRQHAAGQTVVTGTLAYNGSNLYRANGAGTTGATPLTHTSGNASDGTISWAFVRTFPAGFPTHGNKIASFMANGSKIDVVTDNGSGNIVS